MSCIKTGNKPDVLNLTWAADAKGYNPDELSTMITHITNSIAWLEQECSVYEDIVTLRVGIPHLGSDQTTTAETIYETDLTNGDLGVESIDDVTIIKAIGIDAIKITAKADANGTYSKQYAYKSDYIHQIYGEYFFDGIENRTGLSRYDSAINNALISAIPVEYLKDTSVVDGISLDTIVDHYSNVKLTDTWDVPRYGIPALSVQVTVPLEPKATVYKYAYAKDVLNSPTIVSKGKAYEEVPGDVLKALTYISQNSWLIKGFAADELGGSITGKIGDQLVLTVKQLIAKLEVAKSKAQERIGTFYPENYEELKYIFEYLGYEQAFKDVQYGGAITNGRALLRIPASAENQEILEDLLELQEIADYVGKDSKDVTQLDKDNYFEHVFPVKSLSDIDETLFNSTSMSAAAEAKVVHYKDVQHVINALGARNYSSTNVINYEDLYVINRWCRTRYTKEDYAIINGLTAPVKDGSKGCEILKTREVSDGDGGSTIEEYSEYRHYYINQDWLFGDTSLEKAIIVLHMGFDLSLTQNFGCPFDTVLTIAIIIALACATGVFAGGWTGTSAAQYAVLTSAIIGIGTTLGVIKGKDAKNAAIFAAAVSIYAGGVTIAESGSMWTTASIQAALGIVSSATSAVTTYENYETNKAIEGGEKEIGANEEAAELYESELRLMYGPMHESHVRNVCEANPYDYLGVYDKYSVFDGVGFQGTGLSRSFS